MKPITLQAIQAIHQKQNKKKSNTFIGYLDILTSSPTKQRSTEMGLDKINKDSNPYLQTTTQQSLNNSVEEMKHIQLLSSNSVGSGEEVVQ